MNKLEVLVDYCQSLGTPLSSDQLEQLSRFHHDLYEKNEVMNLTRVSAEDAVFRHYLDSILVSALIPKDSTVLDIGTGPGFPSWLLAWFRPDLKVTGMDGSNKGLIFLRSQALPNLTVVQARAEEPPSRESFDFVTGRALAPLPIQIELAAAQAKIGGVVVPFRTPTEREAATKLKTSKVGLELETIHEVLMPGTDVVRLFPVWRKGTATPREFPRPWSKIKQKPLA